MGSIDIPLLVLAGGKDVETPAQECVEHLEPLRVQGQPVVTHAYEDATHCWDCKNLNGFSKTDIRGTKVTYRYDAEATRDAEERMFAFFEQHLGPR